MTGNETRRTPVIADVARLAAVSVPTVSRVLTGAAKVAPDKRARVLDAIAQLNYRPSAIARALVTRSSRTIAIVAGDTSRYGYAETIRGLEESARAAGYTVTITVVDSAEPKEIGIVAELLRDQSADGIAVLKFDMPGVGVLRALPSGTSVVAVSGSRDRGFPQALIDEARAARALTAHLLGLGHDTVHHVRVPPSRRVDGRTLGWRQALREAGASVPSMFDASWEPRSGREIAYRIADRDDVTAIFCGNDEIAMGVIRGLHDRGIRAALRHVEDLGHRSVAFLAGPATSWMSRSRWEAAIDEASARGLSIVEIGPGIPTLEGGEASFKRVRASGVTAILSYNDLMAIGLMRACQAAGVSIPGDLSIIGFDDIFGADLTSPALTTIRSPLSDAGEAAVRLLLTDADRHETEPRIATLQTSLVIRESSGPRNERRPANLRWGIIGTGAISDKIVDDFTAVAGACVVGVASRTDGAANTFAERHGLAFATNDRARLLARPDVDAVYIATPTATHLPIALEALNAGKHVLVEKPMTMNEEETTRIFECAARVDRFAMEAMWMRFIPLHNELHRRIEHGALGRVRSVRAAFGLPMPEGGSRWDSAAGGSTVLDQGIYPVTLAQRCFGAPERISARGEIRDGVDVSAHIELEFPGGGYAQLGCSMVDFTDLSASIAGTHGWFHIEPMFWGATQARLHAESAEQIFGTPGRLEYAREGNGYRQMLRSVNAAIDRGDRENPMHNRRSTLEIARTLDAVRSALGL